MNKFNIILHTTTSCNYNCSYCDVVKDKKQLSYEQLNIIVDFILKNYKFINVFKFFGWEPLLAFENIKYIIDKTYNIFWNKFEIVTNTTLLNDNIWEYFSKYFETIFFSIDSENEFNYEKVFKFINKYNLKDKVYFNLIISPWKEKESLKQFEFIYKNWYKNFNLLPVYFIKNWEKENLLDLSNMIKKIILDKSLIDIDIKLYWFQDNNWYNALLTYSSVFIDIDLKIYYSDFVSTRIWKTIKEELFLWNFSDFNFNNINLDIIRKKLEIHEKKIIANIKWQSELHKIMDYFSKYLNIKKWIIKD